MKLIFEKGAPGQHLSLMPACDVPVVAPEHPRTEPLPLPHVSETELTRLRTEIMAGEGPDAFILDATVPGTVTDSGEPLEALFPNVEKSMYSHLFFDLEDMAQSSEIIDLESCNKTVMDVGVTEDGRFLLPLTYSLSALILDPSILSDPAYVFTTLDELLQSDEEALKGIMAWGTFRLFPDCLGLLADYTDQNLLVTQDSLQQAIEQADAFSAFQEHMFPRRSGKRQGGASAFWVRPDPSGTSSRHRV